MEGLLREAAVAGWLLSMSRADSPPPPPSSPDCSLGIWTLRRGRLGSERLVLSRDGPPAIPGALEVLAVR